MDINRIKARIELAAIPFGDYKDLMGGKYHQREGTTQEVDVPERKPVKWDKNRYKSLFKKYSDKPNPYRIYLTLDQKHPSEIEDLKVPPEIEDYLFNKGYWVDNYLAGTVMGDGGKQANLGNILKDEPRLKRLYDNDPQLKGKKKLAAGKFMVVISRHPYDILGASTDRGWDSCFEIKISSNPDSDWGGNWQYSLTDVEEGALIAYLIDVDKQRDKVTGKLALRPSARLSIRPFKNQETGDTILWHSGVVYGDAPLSFQRTVERWLKENQNIKQGNVYNISDEVYVDRHASYEDLSFLEGKPVDEISDYLLKRLLTQIPDLKQLLLSLQSVKIPYQRVLTSLARKVIDEFDNNIDLDDWESSLLSSLHERYQKTTRLIYNIMSVFKLMLESKGAESPMASTLNSYVKELDEKYRQMFDIDYLKKEYDNQVRLWKTDKNYVLEQLAKTRYPEYVPLLVYGFLDGTISQKDITNIYSNLNENADTLKTIIRGKINKIYTGGPKASLLLNYGVLPSAYKEYADKVAKLNLT